MTERMRRRIVLPALAIALLAVLETRHPIGAQQSTGGRPPNFVLIYADDMGYADIGPFSTKTGAQRPKTPNLDRMAKEGARLTSFYVAQAVCSASRAALLTGSYSNRVSISGALNHTADYGLNLDEQIIPEVLKQRGYATAMVGKWHLGHRQPFLPIHQGFDEYLGLPYSNDMWPRHPQQKDFYPDLPLIEGDQIVKLDPDQSQLTTMYTERAVRFIKGHRDQPFFLYVAHAMPHVPLFVSGKFKGKTRQGLYGDVIAEIDWSVGQILETLKKEELDDNTLVIFTSDNGPWLSYGNHGGLPRTVPRRQRHRVRRWCARAVRRPVARSHSRRRRVVSTGDDNRRAADARPARRCRRLPRIASSTAGTSGRCSPPARMRSRRTRFSISTGVRSSTRCAAAAGSCTCRILTSRSRPQAPTERLGRYVRKELELSLFDLEADPGESKDVATANPDVVKDLMRYVEQARDDLGDSLVKRTGKNVRPVGKL